MAVIEASPLANPTRPVMIYVGGLDGMMHAICGSVQGNCTQLGMELWAFIPRTQLGYLKTNNAMVNGTPRVADVYGDFTGGGTESWRTILTFQTGGGDPTLANMGPAVYALDVTDPTNPTIAWEYTTPSSRAVASVMPKSAPMTVALLLWTIVRAGLRPLATLVKTVRQLLLKRVQPVPVHELVAGGMRVAVSNTGNATLDSRVALLETEPIGTARTCPL